MKLSEIKGLKEKRIQKLNESGIYCPEDLILHFPVKYFDVNSIPQFIDGEETVFIGTVIEPAKRMFVRRGLSIVKAKISTSSGQIVTATWFNQPYIFNSLIVGKSCCFLGRVKTKGKSYIELSSPSIYQLDVIGSNNQIIPIYRPIKGLPYKTLIDAIHMVLARIKVNGYLTLDACEKFSIMPLDRAIRALHFPTDLSEVKAAARSVTIEHLSYTISVFNVTRSLGSGVRSFFYDINHEKLNNFINQLPFELTVDQKAAIDVIVKDFHSYQRMNRLIQGDVGCGKTIVAFLAMYYAALSGYQSVLMAPTEILARQHYETALKLFENTNVKIEYLSGSQPKPLRDTSLFNIKHGNADIVIGTHSLISDAVEFFKLSLVITDEQQRFGVSQRALLENKTSGADTMVMTATPIPRTLGLTLYGDLTQTLIKTMPSGRPKIYTHLVYKQKLADMYNYIKDCAAKDMQTYIVCPRIEDEEGELTSVKQMYSELKGKFEEGSLGLLHGQMKEKDKNSVMNSFYEGKHKILLSTTMVEVGIDVKRAVNIVIFDPDRYGLSQLHQLRGRVGRGTFDSYCFLIADGIGDEAKKRLEYFVGCRDGFLLAEYDFEARGAGDFLGTRQHGKEASLIGEKLTPEIVMSAKELSDYILSFPNSKTEIAKNIDENKVQYIKNITLN